jgi:hypothetical protein
MIKAAQRWLTAQTGQKWIELNPLIIENLTYPAAISQGERYCEYRENNT